MSKQSGSSARCRSYLSTTVRNCGVLFSPPTTSCCGVAACTSEGSRRMRMCTMCCCVTNKIGWCVFVSTCLVLILLSEMQMILNSSCCSCRCRCDTAASSVLCGVPLTVADNIDDAPLLSELCDTPLVRKEVMEYFEEKVRQLKLKEERWKEWAK